MNIYQPIVIIGAGRSGTTLLTRIFSRHPDIDFHGETSFLLPRLWLELWEDRFWLNWQHYTNTNPHSVCESFPDISDYIFNKEKQRIGSILAKVIIDVFKIDINAYEVWGYKEVWNGSSQFQFDWLPYDIVFPEAVWVHLVRNPFEFARSCADWNREIFCIQYLHDRLIDWVSIINHSRMRVKTERYFEICYEHLTSRPREILEPVLDSVKIKWNTYCEDALKSYILRSRDKYFKKNSANHSLSDIKNMVPTIDGLSELLNEFNYQIPEEIERQLASYVEIQDRPNLVELHLQSPELQQPHKAQYLLQQKYHERQKQHHRIQMQCQQLQRQYEDIIESETYMLAKKIQQSFLMKIWRFITMKTST